MLYGCYFIISLLCFYFYFFLHFIKITNKTTATSNYICLWIFSLALHVMSACVIQILNTRLSTCGWWWYLNENNNNKVVIKKEIVFSFIRKRTKNIMYRESRTKQNYKKKQRITDSKYVFVFVYVCRISYHHFECGFWQ